MVTAPYLTTLADPCYSVTTPAPAPVVALSSTGLTRPLLPGGVSLTVSGVPGRVGVPLSDADAARVAAAAAAADHAKDGVAAANSGDSDDGCRRDSKDTGGGGGSTTPSAPPVVTGSAGGGPAAVRLIGGGGGAAAAAVVPPLVLLPATAATLDGETFGAFKTAAGVAARRHFLLPHWTTISVLAG